MNACKRTEEVMQYMFCVLTYSMVTEVVKFFHHDLFQHVQVSDHYSWPLPDVVTTVKWKRAL